MTTNYKGIDYGLGQSNRNTETGIRFGVIPINALNPESLDSVYQSGTDLDYEAYLDEAKAKIRSALESALDGYFSTYRHTDDGRVYQKSKLDLAVESASDEAFEAIGDRLGDAYDGTGDWRVRFEEKGLTIQTDGQGDVWVMKSPYFTYAQFCSPCAPGACYLTNPLDHPDDNNKCYCLGSDWFYDDKAPYTVYSVETGKPI